jgi:hypothetical protein
MTTPTPPPNQDQGGGANVFTRKIGPLPLWGWMGVGLAAALAYTYWKQNKQANSSSTTSASGTTGTTDSSLVPQFVNQTYVDQTPPAAPPLPGPPGPAGPAGPAGPPGAAASAAQSGTAQASKYPAPQNVQASRLSNTSAKIMWDYITSVNPHPTSYTIAVHNKANKVVSQTTVNAPDTANGQAVATVSGLPTSGGPFKVYVWANGGKEAPPHGSATLTL